MNLSQLNFFFGLGIFLFGMSQLESGIRSISGERLNYWLRRSTGTPIGSVSTGVVTTAILQSSSMVSLLVLAFASANLLPLTNAIGIILGANLGTTVTGWLITTLGFKLDLGLIAIPLLGCSAFVMAIKKPDTKAFGIGLIFFGIGLLLFGLGLMKTSMETIPQRWDVAVLRGHSPFVYLLFGILISSLIQSSSAVIMMALAALNAEFISLHEAAALVIGADLGTTSTTILASLTGNLIKRQLAFAHCFFNLTVDSLAFVFLLPALPLILGILGINDQLYGLVAFHSIINVLGLAAFMPFIGVYSKWIVKLFEKSKLQSQSLIQRVSADVVDAALAALQQTVRLMCLQAMVNCMKLFSLRPAHQKEGEQELSEEDAYVLAAGAGENFSQGYEYLKRQEGEILRYSLKIQAQQLQDNEVLELERLQLITRAVVYNNKTLKDIQADLLILKRSQAPGAAPLHAHQKQYHKSVYRQLIDLLVKNHPADYIKEELSALHGVNDKHYQEMDKEVHANVSTPASDGTLISTQLNVNREVHHAFKSMLTSLEALFSLEQNVGAMNLRTEQPD